MNLDEDIAGLLDETVVEFGSGVEGAIVRSVSSIEWECYCGNGSVRGISKCTYCGMSVSQSESATEKAVEREYISGLLLGPSPRSSTESPQTIFEYLRVLAKSQAIRRGIPDYVREEAWSQAVEEILRHGHRFSEDKGTFSTWVSRILINTLLRMARDDVTANKRVLIHLDAGTFFAPSGSGIHNDERFASDAVIPDPYEKSDAARVRLVQREIATSTLGDACFTVCLEEIQFGKGWQGRAARRVGLSDSGISSKIKVARGKYREVRDSILYG